MARPRLSIALLMMVVLTAATASALGARLYRHMPTTGNRAVSHPTHLTFAFLLAIVLTGLTLAGWRKHIPVLALLQINVACVSLLILIGLLDLKAERALVYWFQANFLVLVAVPLAIRGRVLGRQPRGSLDRLQAHACEALAFASLNIVLVLVGILIQLSLLGLVENFLKF